MVEVGAAAALDETSAEELDSGTGVEETATLELEELGAAGILTAAMTPAFVINGLSAGFR